MKLTVVTERGTANVPSDRGSGHRTHESGGEAEDKEAQHAGG